MSISALEADVMSNGLEGLRVGSEVVISGVGLGGRDLYLTQVLRITPGGRIIVKHGSGECAFRPSGHQIGGSIWNSLILQVATDELKAAILDQEMRARYLKKISETAWTKLPTEMLRKVTEILP